MEQDLVSHELTGRERFRLALQHQEGDRIPIVDGFWGGLIERWYGEGLPREMPPSEYFGFEMMDVRADCSLRLPATVLEETADYLITQDSYGGKSKTWKHESFLPGRVEYPVKTRADWEELKERARWGEGRVDWEASRRAQERAQARGVFFTYSGAHCWDGTLPIIGQETLLLAMAEDQAWVREMFEAFTDLYLAGAEEMMGGGIEFDGAFVCDDMGFRSGTLFSPRAYEELYFPLDKRVCDFFKARGLPVILHSCGRVSSLIPRLIAAGYACLQPLEAKAGMDLVELKRKYGHEIALMGGIDVRCLEEQDERVMEAEIKNKIPIAMQGGGYIYALDGPVPEGVSLARYRRFLELVLHYGRYRK